MPVPASTGPNQGAPKPWTLDLEGPEEPLVRSYLSQFAGALLMPPTAGRLTIWWSQPSVHSSQKGWLFVGGQGTHSGHFEEPHIPEQWLHLTRL